MPQHKVFQCGYPVMLGQVEVQQILEITTEKVGSALGVDIEIPKNFDQQRFNILGAPYFDGTEVMVKVLTDWTPAVNEWFGHRGPGSGPGLHEFQVPDAHGPFTATRAKTYAKIGAKVAFEIDTAVDFSPLEFRAEDRPMSTKAFMLVHPLESAGHIVVEAKLAGDEKELPYINIWQAEKFDMSARVHRFDDSVVRSDEWQFLQPNTAYTLSGSVVGQPTTNFRTIDLAAEFALRYAGPAGYVPVSLHAVTEQLKTAVAGQAFLDITDKENDR